MRSAGFIALMLFSALGSGPIAAQTLPSWTERFALHPPTASRAGVTPPSNAALPSFTVTPEEAGLELVRVSLPFAPGTFPEGLELAVIAADQEIAPDLRVLTYHPGTPRSVRRAILTFPFDFSPGESISFGIALREAANGRTRLGDSRAREPLSFSFGLGPLGDQIAPMEMTLSPNGLLLTQEGKTLLDAQLLAPALTGTPEYQVEIVEQGQHYLWARVLVPDPAWPRIIELRRDALGRIALRAQLQRLEPGAEHTPDVGWRLVGAQNLVTLPESPHIFTRGEITAAEGEGYAVRFPDAHLKKRGEVRAEGADLMYLRAKAEEQVPQQLAAWRDAVLVFQPQGTAPLNALLEPPLLVQVESTAMPASLPFPAELAPWPRLSNALLKHYEDMGTATPTGDDFGNVSGMPQSGVYGMNRLNHCPPIFEAAAALQQHGDTATAAARLREVALQWCSNFHDLSIWWGEEKPEEFGGTRYNNRAAQNQGFANDPNFMWRSDNAVHFCTKGYDSFFYAWEETGDPRMATALRWQVDYAARMIHTNRGEARNIGDVIDFVRLYEFTGAEAHLDQALRLFRELREKVGEDGLFSQSGDPIVAEGPFIDNDSEGYGSPFAKPYIIGYALAGLPALLRHAPEEPRLQEVISAVAHFLARTVDPGGGWRYPHPRSSRLFVSQAVEHAAQLARAAEVLEARGENIESLLDAIEIVLQARVLGIERDGNYYGGVDAWERSTGAVEAGATVSTLYARPEDRDASRDYTEGTVSSGGNSPEGVVYFPEALAFYLQHRPAERLYNATPQLTRVLDRIAPLRAPEAQPAPIGFGFEHDLATFVEQQKARLRYPMSWLAAPKEAAQGHARNTSNTGGFEGWRAATREKLFELLLTPPPRAEFAPEIVAVEDRGSYEARKITLSLSGFYRLHAYLLVPKGEGPFPAVVALHDHGAHFTIGKEKVVRPFGVSEEVLADSTDWITKYYGGRWFGDELAKQGYVVFATDALYWGERRRKEGEYYDFQHAISANLLQIGMTWPGIVTWDDVRSAEFVASLPQVDLKRIGAMGLSMGSHRTFMLAAATDYIAAGAAICWLGTTEHLMVPGNNQTTGQSAYSMLVPNLRNFLDYPDVASIACPKPMLFFNGTEDPLFPVPGVEAAFAKMLRIWESQGAGDKLHTKLWPVPHEFNAAMQDEAYAWLEKMLRP